MLNYSSDTVSIIIPVYNTQDYLKECIDSALSQTYKKIQVIAVNDGSTDDSLSILKKYSDKIEIISKENGGTASALNLGIKNMKGEWFKWLSADDLLYPSAIEELVNVAKKLTNVENIIFYSNYDIIDTDGNTIKQFIEPNYNNLDQFEFNTILLDHYIGNGTTSLIHKSALDKYGLFDETIGFQEDYELWMRYCLQYNCRLHLIPKILAKYRIHQNQLTSQKVGKSLKNAERVRQIVLGKLDHDLQEKYIKALKQYKKKKPLAIRSRKTVRDIMLKILPQSVSIKLVKIYLERKSE